MLEPVCDGVSGAMGVDGRDMAGGDAGRSAQTGKQGQISFGVGAGEWVRMDRRERR